MRLIKKINNNVAFAKNDENEDVFVVGKGLGFIKMPQTIQKNDPRIEKTYVLEKKYKYLGELFEEIPADIILIADKVVKEASVFLKYQFQNNILLTLADHINFAIERVEKGIQINNPLHWDVLEIYPKEVDAARRAITTLEKELKIVFPEVEVTFIALHFANAYLGERSLSKAHEITDIVKSIADMVKAHVGDKIDTSSLVYKRFIVHVRYFVIRQLDAIQLEGDNTEIYEMVSKTMPKAMQIVSDIDKKINMLYNWNCSDSESVYLAIHIHKLISS